MPKSVHRRQYQALKYCVARPIVVSSAPLCSHTLRSDLVEYWGRYRPGYRSICHRQNRVAVLKRNRS
jgi:hypothetical protein